MKEEPAEEAHGYSGNIGIKDIYELKLCRESTKKKIYRHIIIIYWHITGYHMKTERILQEGTEPLFCLTIDLGSSIIKSTERRLPI